MARERHQHLERSQMELVDQHGRTWLAESEVSFSGPDQKPRQMPCGPLMPGFTAPHDFYPPAHVLRVRYNRPGRVEILYRPWLEMQRRSHKDYETQLHQYASLMYGEKAAEAVRTMPSELRTIAGLAPRPIEPIIACIQGNRYALGLTDVVDARIEPFLRQDAEMRRTSSAGLEELDLAGYDFGEAGVEAMDPEMLADLEPDDPAFGEVPADAELDDAEAELERQKEEEEARIAQAKAEKAARRRERATADK